MTWSYRHRKLLIVGVLVFFITGIFSFLLIKNLKIDSSKKETPTVLTASKEDLLFRRSSYISDYNTIMQYYDLLNKQYDSIMQYSKNYIDVYHYDTSLENESQIQSKVKRLVR